MEGTGIAEVRAQRQRRVLRLPNMVVALPRRQVRPAAHGVRRRVPEYHLSKGLRHEHRPVLVTAASAAQQAEDDSQQLPPREDEQHVLSHIGGDNVAAVVADERDIDGVGG